MSPHLRLTSKDILLLLFWGMNRFSCEYKMKSPGGCFQAIGKQNIVRHFPLVKRGLKAVNLPHLQAADSRHSQVASAQS